MSASRFSAFAIRLTTLVLLVGLLALLTGCPGGGSSVGLKAQPLSSPVNVRSSVTLTATVTGTTNTGVNWLVMEGAAGGSITPAGVYTAPSVAGTYHVVVSSIADPSKTVVIPIIVQSANATGTVQ